MQRRTLAAIRVSRSHLSTRSMRATAPTTTVQSEQQMTEAYLQRPASQKLCLLQSW